MNCDWKISGASIYIVGRVKRNRLWAGNSELESENCIVFRMGEGAPVDKETLVAALKAELRFKRAARDPHYLIWCEYVKKLRTFLDRDTPFEEVID